MQNTNIIVFGESGSGKTSLINMIMGNDVGETSSGAQGCTVISHSYETAIGDLAVTLHDTAGLGESRQGQVSNTEAILQLYCLLRTLEDGISLLLYVMKAPARITQNTTRTWKLFNDVMCQGKVPIVVVVTGLEQEEPDMESWWPYNEEVLRSNRMVSQDHACVTAIKGPFRRGKFAFQEEYDDSRVWVRDMISRSVRIYPWYMEKTGNSVAEFVSECGMDREEATALVNVLNGMFESDLH